MDIILAVILGILEMVFFCVTIVVVSTLLCVALVLICILCYAYPISIPIILLICFILLKYC